MFPNLKTQETNTASTQDWLEAKRDMVISTLVEGEEPKAEFTKEDFEESLKKVSKPQQGR